MELNLPTKLKKALEREAADARITLHAHLVKKLERITPLTEHIRIDRLHTGLPALAALLNEVPGVRVMSQDITSDAYWWIKFSIDIQNRTAWHIVQAFAFLFNGISIHEPLPTVFKPTSPPPYLNGGPEDCLFWVIESTYNYIDPLHIANVARGRFPKPLNDEAKWLLFTERTDEASDHASGAEPPFNESPQGRQTPPPLPKSGPPPLPDQEKIPWWKRL